MADASAEELAAAVRMYAKEMEEVGTPDGISEKARRGFEQQVDAMAESDKDDYDNMRNYPLDEYNENDNPALTFFDYVWKTCN